jgi:hypothetical protein
VWYIPVINDILSDLSWARSADSNAGCWSGLVDVESTIESGESTSAGGESTIVVYAGDFDVYLHCRALLL